MGSGLAVASISIRTTTIQKVRIRILVFLLFVVALLDRVNIGFAALTMNRELAITSQQYGLIFGIFFFRYFFFENPQQSAAAQDRSAGLDRPNPD
jgi:MFS transporter, ACS family, tartrate transporter